MKNKLFAIAASAALALGLAACNDDAEDSAAAQHAANAVDEAKAAVALSWDQFSDYSIEKKEQAVSFLREQSSALDKQIAALREKAANAKGEAKDEYNEAIEELAEEREDLREQIDELQAATAETWDAVKRETRQKWNNFVSFLDRKTDELD